DKFSLDNGSETIVAIHPWTSDNVKKWPVQSFYKLAERIITELKLNIVIVGSSDEAAKSKKLFKDFSGKLLDLTGKTNLPELAAVLRRCACLVTADSGPMHLAASVGTPVIALFRNDMPGKTAKRWGPWGEGHVVLEAADLRKISVEEVFEQLNKVGIRS
ncbi:MAG: glycosyltransferase family 9 protein, partial [Candidatus Omnitrophica bacterium]|nr:glycosyltransferase family 9 protein [Candidatus Omnitrophota bacterium]